MTGGHVLLILPLQQPFANKYNISFTTIQLSYQLPVLKVLKAPRAWMVHGILQANSVG